MKIEHDTVADTAYVDLTADGIKAGGVARTLQANADINLDFDKEGRLIGVELLEASKLLPPQAIG